VARLARETNPGAASARARRSRRNGRTSREETLADGAAAKRQVGPTDVDETPVNRGRDQYCEGPQRTPRASPRFLGQAAITARPAGPERAPKERRPRMTRAGGVSTNTQRNHRRREAPKTARASSKFATPTWASMVRSENQRRSGMVRRPVASETERRGQRTPKGRETRNLTRGGRSTCPPRARRAANRPARWKLVVPQAHAPESPAPLTGLLISVSKSSRDRNDSRNVGPSGPGC